MVYNCFDRGGGGGQCRSASPCPPLLPSGVQGPDPDLFGSERVRVRVLGLGTIGFSPFDPIFIIIKIFGGNATPLLSAAAANLFLDLFLSFQIRSSIDALAASSSPSSRRHPPHSRGNLATKKRRRWRGIPCLSSATEAKSRGASCRCRASWTRTGS
ncbi:uncharacterized protein LOC121980669 [Zingiber officinale]|uniref:uncharacterized protein LOC121980669 n=1 Tax=Zingiber officinale TaxID=94328 RepID=UPI001C4A9751|nr:uncharacterized protein LOC121980669 [Zingiber officinale]